MQVLFDQVGNFFNNKQEGIDFSSKFPQELLLKVLQECDFNSIKNLNQSNKFFNKLTEENTLTGDCLKYSTLLKIMKVAGEDINKVCLFTHRFVDNKFKNIHDSRTKKISFNDSQFKKFPDNDEIIIDTNRSSIKAKIKYDPYYNSEMVHCSNLFFRCNFCCKHNAKWKDILRIGQYPLMFVGTVAKVSLLGEAIPEEAKIFREVEKIAQANMDRLMESRKKSPPTCQDRFG